MKKNLILIFSIFTINLYGQNITFWKKKFNQGTLYISFFKNHSHYGTHIREYFTGTNDAVLLVVKYSNGKYKLQKENGWSNTHYIKFSNGKLIRTSPRMGSIKFEKIKMSEVPKYILSRNTRFPKKVVRE